jgi:hypothetical protein
MSELTQLGEGKTAVHTDPKGSAPKQIHVTPKAVQKIRGAFVYKAGDF